MSALAKDTTKKIAAQPPKKKSRIAHWLLPQIEENSALLPSDKWVKDTVRSILKEDKSLRKNIGRVLRFAGLGLAAIAGGITAAVILFPAVIPVAAAALASVAVTGFAVKKTIAGVNTIKSDNINGLKETVGKKYLEYKAGELKAAWQKKQIEYRAKKEAEKKAAAEARAVAQARANAEKEAAALKAAQKGAPPPEPPVQEKGIRGFGKRLLREAMKRAQDFEENSKPQQPPANPPANTNKPPQQKPAQKK